MVLFPIVAYIPNNVEYNGPIIAEPDDIIMIESMYLGSHIKKGTVDKKHLCCSKVEVLDTFMRKSWTLQFNEEVRDGTIQRKLIKDLDISNQVDFSLNVFHSYNNHQTSLEWLTLKCTLPKVVEWNPSTIICLEEIKKAHIDVFKLHALNDNNHFDFQGQGTSLKNISIIMTSDIGFTASAKSGSEKDPQFLINGI